MEQPQPWESPETRQEQEEGLHYCHFDPQVETRLACGRCGKYICPRCMVQTPVGARCRDCGHVAKVPTFDVRPSYYLRASVAGGIAAIAGGILWGVVLALSIPFIGSLSAIGVGYGIGEAISVSVNRKRGAGLALVAGLSMTLAVVISGILGWVFLFGNIFLLLAIVIGYLTAIRRVR